ncbi:MAG TPA: DUF6062 family protein [Vitreimonas sp.]|nr:DUF6062 family protein [Vitreimonas sp.]
MAELPVRDIADVPLAALFGKPGCPLCRRVTDITTRFVDAMLYESVNDVPFRAELDAGRGFCRHHVHEVLSANRNRTGGSLASAILLGAMLRVRRGELGQARGGGRARSRRLEAAAAAPDCPICRQADRGLAGAAESLVRLSAQEAWAEALAQAPWCLEHLVRLMAEPRRPPAFASVEGRQLERLERLQALLESFAHHSSEDRRHKLTDEERAAVDEAARTLGGG